MERLHKHLARAGIASRRAAERLIVAGRVRVNGAVVTELGSKIDPEQDHVTVDNQPIAVAPERRWYLLYKPAGVVTTLRDPQGRAHVGEALRGLGGRVFPVGRLDADAEGALLVTDDGETAHKLMHPRHQVERTYLVKVKGEPAPGSLAKLCDGVRLEDGWAKTSVAVVFERAETYTWLKLVVTEGRNHLIKRLCAAIGHPVLRLFRPSHAGISVMGLEPGALRKLSEAEVDSIRAVAEGGAIGEPALELPPSRQLDPHPGGRSAARPS